MEDEMVGLISGSVSGLGGRIYPLVLPQNATLPACTFQRISTNPLHSRDDATTLEMNRTQFVVYANTYGTARTNADAIKSLFKTYSGNNQVKVSFIENQLDDIEEETKLRKSIVDVMYWGIPT